MSVEKKKIEQVMFLCEYRSLYGGNFISSLMALEKYLNAQGTNCIYCFPIEAKEREWTKKLSEAGHTIEYFDFKLSRSKCIKAVDALVEKHHIDLIHLHFGQLVNVQLYHALHSKVKLVVHLHSDFSGGAKRSWKAKLSDFLTQKLLARNVKFICVSSHWVTPKNKNKMIHVPNGLAEERVPCEHKSREEVRSELGISEQETLCVMFGWSPYVKGVDIAVEAMKKLCSDGGLYKLAIVCGRDVTKEKMQQYISDRTTLTGKEDYLLYLEPTEDVFRYHGAADIHLSASRSEGFPYSVLEALSIGKKCVVSNIPAMSWSAKYGGVHVFESGNAQKCAAAISNAQAEHNVDMRITAESAKKDYAIDAWCKSVVDVYNSCK